jgi:hypothetical protein
MPSTFHRARQSGRRAFLRQAGGALCFVLPVFAGGRVGQPVLATGPWFVDAAREAGLAAFRDMCGSLAKDYLVETLGGGVAIFDYNGDGLMDVLLVNGSSFELLDNPRLPPPSSRLFRNNGDGTFTDVTHESGLLNQGWGVGVAVADFDNDGHPDVFFTNFGRNALFHNNGNGTFADVTADAGLEGGNWSTGAAWGDYDNDGRLDLYVARYVDFDRARIPRPGADSYCRYHGVPVACGPQGLPGLADLVYHNDGHGRFREVSNDIGVRDSDRAYGLSVVWCDFDSDGHLDAYVANDSTPNYLWHNKGNGTFEEIGIEAGCALSADGRAQSSMGIALGDYNNDGWMDLFVTNFSEDYSTLYRNRGGQFGGQFDDVTYEAGLGTAGYTRLKWGTGFIDVENSGWKDLFVANGHIYPQADRAGNVYKQSNQLFRNLRDGRFTELSPNESGFEAKQSSRGAAWGDLQNDGRLSIVVNNIDAEPFLYRRRKPEGHWLRLRLIGTRSNRDAVGARVQVTAGGLTQTDVVSLSGSYVSSLDPRLHFGLGAAREVERVDIRWPDRMSERHTALAADREYTFKQSS